TANHAGKFRPLRRETNTFYHCENLMTLVVSQHTQAGEAQGSGKPHERAADQERLKQRRLLRQRLVGRFSGALQPQEALTAQAQHLALLHIAHVHPAETLLAAAQAATAEPTIVGLTNAATRAGDVEKLKLLRHGAPPAFSC